jgi:hypothetical protein
MSISDSALATELLSAVRSKIRDFGYSASRVLFELFQNADDAYRQHDGPETDAGFRVESLLEDVGGFRVVHWGCPINHLGRDADEGRRVGHERDLLNMLLMSFSEKRPGDDLTGKLASDSRAFMCSRTASALRADSARYARMVDFCRSAGRKAST